MALPPLTAELAVGSRLRTNRARSVTIEGVGDCDTACFAGVCGPGCLNACLFSTLGYPACVLACCGAAALACCDWW